MFGRSSFSGKLWLGQLKEYDRVAGVLARELKYCPSGTNRDILVSPAPLITSVWLSNSNGQHYHPLLLHAYLTNKWGALKRKPPAPQPGRVPFLPLSSTPANLGGICLVPPLFSSCLTSVPKSPELYFYICLLSN